jgi:sec-independent protein translocase protein TatA
MPNIGPLELVIILVIALLILGPGKLPEVGASLGKSIREFRKASSDVQEAVNVTPTATPPAAPPAPAAPQVTDAMTAATPVAAVPLATPTSAAATPIAATPASAPVAPVDPAPAAPTAPTDQTTVAS